MWTRISPAAWKHAGPLLEDVQCWGHLIKHWSLTQSTIALSSAEAELTGICKGSSISIGLVSLAKDLNLELELEVKTDATAAIGICRRRGLGKVRHLATADLWIQDKVRTGGIILSKVDGASNPADMLTKHIPRPLLEKHMRSMSLKLDHGRAESAPNVDG